LIASRLRVTKVLPYQGASPPFISNLALAFFSGLLLVFAFPNWSLWSLGWVGVAPLIMALVRERRFWRGLVLGWLAGFVFFAGTSHWITYSMHNYGGIALWLSYLLMLIIGMIMGAFTGLFGAILSFATRRLGGWAILSAPFIWAGTEYARLLVTGVGWNALGYSQAFQPAVIQVSRWGGVYLVSLIMVLASTGLVYAMVYLEQRRGLVVLTIAGLIAIGSVAYGESLRPGAEGPHSVTAIAIQPNIPIEGDWSDPAFADRMLDRHVELSEQAFREYEVQQAATAEAGARKVDLVIWPESPTGFAYDRDDVLRRKLAEFTRRHKVYLVIDGWGFPQGGSTGNEVFNRAMVISPAGEKTADYDKVALMPFGEYVPARKWLPFMDRIPALVGDMAAGNLVRPVSIDGTKLGISICFETTRPDLARQIRREGASSFLQLSNEAWFGPSAAPRQVLSQAVFRAVENNTELVRVTNSGLTVKVDRFGLLAGETPMFEAVTRVWSLESEEEAAVYGPTFYTKYGDVVAVCCSILSIAILLISLVRRSR
jgi:apolipoprotein N-acyltransferase